MNNLPANPITATVCPHPLRIERHELTMPSGLSVWDMLQATQPDPILLQHAHVYVGDKYIDQEEWRSTFPVPGDHLTVRIVPGNNFDPVRTVLTVAVVAASFAVGNWIGGMAIAGAAFWGSTAAAGTMIAGMLLVDAIAPPPEQDLSIPGQRTYEDSPSHSIETARNRARLFQPVRVIFGQHRVVPDLGAKQIILPDGGDQVLYGIFSWGYGPLEVTDLKIGETSIHSFDGIMATGAGSYGIEPPWMFPHLYPNIRHREDLNILLETGEDVDRTTQPDTDSARIELTAPQLLGITGLGERESLSVATEILYRQPGGLWNYHSDLTLNAKSTNAVRASRTINFPERAQYEIRLRRLTSYDPWGGYQVYDDVYWSGLISTRNEDPVEMEGVEKTILRIRATDQLSGHIQELNGICTSVLPTWNGSEWSETATRNPASFFRAVLQGPANKRPLPDSRIDLDSLEEWSEFCNDNGFYGDLVIERRDSVFNILRKICSIGRASPTIIDGKWGVVIDRPKSQIIQHFTPRNSWGFRAGKVFKDIPHAFNCRFQNKDKGYRQDIRPVFDDGYNEGNATKYEELQLPGITDPDLIHKHGRFHLAQVRLRPERYTFHTDLEHIVCTQGDLIRCSHPVPLWGIKQARIKKITYNEEETEVLGVKLDDFVTMQEGNTYGIRIRKSDGSSQYFLVDTVPGAHQEVTFSNAISEDLPEEQDLAMFGLAELESVKLLIKSIQPTEGLNAQITCVDYNEAIYEADQEPIPPFDSKITDPVFAVIPAPEILEIESGTAALYRRKDGTIGSRILVSVANHSELRIAYFQMRYRMEDSGESWQSVFEQSEGESATLAAIDVEDEQTYEIQVRNADTFGNLSEWDSTTHTVVGKTQPPSDIEEFSADVSLQGIRLQWLEIPDLDLKKYIIRVGESWETGEEIFRGLADNYLWKVTFAGKYDFWVVAEDTSGNRSENPKHLEVYIENPEVSGFNFNIVGPEVVFTWNKSEGEFGIEEYELSYGSDYETSISITRVKSTSYTLNANWSGSRRFWVTAIDEAGNESTPASTDVVIVSPSKIRNLIPQVIHNNILLRWDKPLKGTLPIDVYELRKGEVLEEAEELGNLDATFAVRHELEKGTYRYWIAARDTAGNIGEWESVSASVDAPPGFALRYDDYLNVADGDVQNLSIIRI